MYIVVHDLTVSYSLYSSHFLLQCGLYKIILEWHWQPMYAHNININAWQIKKEKKEEKKCGGKGEGNDYKFTMLRIEHGG